MKASWTNMFIEIMLAIGYLINTYHKFSKNINEKFQQESFIITAQLWFERYKVQMVII